MFEGKLPWKFLIAACLFYFEDYNVFASSHVLSIGFGGSFLPKGLNIVSLVSTAVVFFALAVMYRRGFRVGERQYDLIVCCLLTMGGALLWFASDQIPELGALDVLALCLMATGHLCFLPQMVKGFAEVGMSWTFFCYAMILVGLSVYFPIMELLPTYATQIFVFVSPFVMRYLFQSAESESRKITTPPPGKKQRIPRILIAILFICGFLVGTASLICLPYGYMNHILSRTSAFLAAAAAILVLYFFYRTSFDRLLFQVGVPLMSLGVLILGVADGAATEVGNGIFYFGYYLFYGVIWALYSYLIRYSSFDYYWLPISAAIGGFLGRVAGVISVSYLGLVLEPGQMMLFVALIVFAALVGSMYLSSNDNMKSGWGSISLKGEAPVFDTYERSCRVVGMNAGLTPREAAVLPYLARGRDKQFISEALGISKGTVKTHVKHIYQKTGVHTQQELIDIVEKVQEHVSDR